MRNLQTWLVHDEVAEQQYVDINLARALRAHAETSHRRFNLQRQMEQFSRRFPGFDGRHAVQKPRLVGNLYWLSFIKRRNREQPIAFFQTREGGAQVGGAVSDVRSQRQISDLLHSASFAGKGERSQQKLVESAWRSDWQKTAFNKQRSEIALERASTGNCKRYLGHFLSFPAAIYYENAMNLDSLLISRDASLLGVLRPALEKISVSVQVCAQAEPSSELLMKHKFDAVIIDCDDLQNGFSLLQSLRYTQSNAKSVSFAVVNGKTTTQEAFQSGANFVLQKPLTPLHAARCLNAALNFMVRERRRYFRHPVDMPLRISLPQNREMTATATNVSEGGMAIRVLGKLAKDAQAQIRFTLPGGKVSLDLKGEVAWADGTGHAGIRFLEVPQSSQYHLEQWLTERLQEEMPAQLQGYTTLP